MGLENFPFAERAIDISFKIVREHGLDKIDTLRISKLLKSENVSAFICPEYIIEIKKEVIKKAWNLLFEYQVKEIDKEPYLEMGVGYIKFAKKEPMLFSSMKNQEFRDLNNQLHQKNLHKSVKLMVNDSFMDGMSEDYKFKIVMQGWIYCCRFAELFIQKFSKKEISGDREEEVIKNFLMENLLYWKGARKFVSS